MSLVDVIKKWEIQYRSYIEQLETWVLGLRKGDLMCLSDLENPQVAERPKVNECSWNNAKNEWAFAGEEESLKERGLQTFSPDGIGAPYDSQSVSVPRRDKSAFTFLLPKDGGSLFVCSIVPVRVER
ncbi:hypothetical protein ASPCADRAFT_128841 [Aspergillus carbonarius ITEM 5010]|uniref:Uncharacterized protein n=1 Tax=Aspergillus carbonarius (strain ITEM 5010) TaxID=602072 RepID=A0A1R3RRP0_ASPC5|nr:hypothetical protein ASPCADRAFT_128841 [Aspergillus carbonarius ITEM 5010]